MTSYNARIEWATREADDGALVDALAEHHAAVSRSDYGNVEAVITLPAQSLRQAAVTALALATSALAAEVLALEVLPTAEFDQRLGLEPVPQLLSVTQVAAGLGVSRQAVLQRLESGTLPGRKVGKAWVIPGGVLSRQ